MSRRKSDNGSKVVLPITPMLDMTFQLLFFFIVNFSPADREGQIDVALPTDRVAAGGVIVEPPDDEPDIPVGLTIRVRTQRDGVHDGEISALSVRDLAGRNDPIEDLDGLRRRLARLRREDGNQQTVKVEADPALQVRQLAKVMDVCRQAGFKNVGVGGPADQGR